jgi:hypothetical protein
MSTVAERVAAERVAQGLPRHVEDEGALAAAAAMVAETLAGPAKGEGGRDGP